MQKCPPCGMPHTVSPRPPEEIDGYRDEEEPVELRTESRQAETIPTAAEPHPRGCRAAEPEEGVEGQASHQMSFL